MSSNAEIESAKKENATDRINWACKLTNVKITAIKKSTTLTEYIKKQSIKWIAHGKSIETFLRECIMRRGFGASN